MTGFLDITNKLLTYYLMLKNGLEIKKFRGEHNCKPSKAVFSERLELPVPTAFGAFKIKINITIATLLKFIMMFELETIMTAVKANEEIS